MTNKAAWRARTAIAAICLSALMFGLEISSVPVILPEVGKLLGGGFTDLQWIMNAYTIASVTVLVAAGVLADRYGRRRVFAVAVAIFGSTSLLCGLAPNILALVIFRFMQGVAGGAMIICGLAILSHQFRAAHARARAFGTWGVGLGFGLGFGPVIGGFLITVADWRWVFFVHIFIAVVTLALTAHGVRESRDPAPGKLDAPGIIALAFALFALVLYITQLPALGFASAPSLAVLSLAIVGFATFVGIELRTKNPMLPFSLFRVRSFSGALLGAVGMNFSFWPLIIFLPIYLERGLGYDVASTSVALLAYTVPTFILPPAAERLALRFGAHTMIPIGLGIIGAGLLLLYIGAGGTEPSWARILPGFLFAGVGLGLTNTPVTNTTTGSVPTARSGMASGIDMTARLTCLAVNIAVMGALQTAGIAQSLREHLPQLSGAQLKEVAEDVANGDPTASFVGSVSGLSIRAADQLVITAVTHAFGLAALYGAIAVVVLAIASRTTFGRRLRTGSVAAVAHPSQSIDS